MYLGSWKVHRVCGVTRMAAQLNKVADSVVAVAAGAGLAEPLQEVQRGLTHALSLASIAYRYGDLTDAARHILAIVDDLAPELEAMRALLLM